MRTLCFLLCIVYAYCFYDKSTSSEKDKIVGGKRTSIENIPYQANIFRDGRSFCGATIIDRLWVVTASHCVYGKPTSELSVRTGSGRRTKDGIFYQMENLIMHPEYNPTNYDNDIALIKLSKPIVFNKAQKKVKIAKPNDIPREGQLMLISGFGREGANLPASDDLKSVIVSVTNQTLCYKAYDDINDPITNNMFCAGDENADSCSGDSGGPGIINGKLYGIVSSGKGCALKSFPGVYTRVYKYYNWIVENTGLQKL